MEGKFRRGQGFYPGSRIRPQESDPNYGDGSGGGFEIAFGDNYIGRYQNTNTSQSLNQASYTAITGTSGDFTPTITSGKTYGILLNGKINTDGATGEFEFVINFSHTSSGATPHGS